MRSLSYRPRKEEPKKDESKNTAPETQTAETQPDASTEFDESVVIN